MGVLFLLSIPLPLTAAGLKEAAGPEEPTGREQAAGPEEAAGREQVGPEDNAVKRQYEQYLERFAGVQNQNDLEKAGFRVLEDQVFLVTLENLGEVLFLPALDTEYDRLALFFADEAGNIVCRSDQFAPNFTRMGEVRQQNSGLAAVSFQDVNKDGSKDLVLIANCRAGKKEFYTGDVLYASREGFYRDWRVSDKINRFGMNKSVDSIIAYTRDGKSTEFLYTAATRQELLDHGFEIINEQYYRRDFEKLGRLWVMPGKFSIADYDIFMIYLINEQGYIVWSFSPMENYDNLYALKGINCRDIDGDGMKDMIVLANYSRDAGNGQMLVESDYEIYYQRTGSFLKDTEVKKHYACTEEDTVEELIRKARAYWGWSVEPEG